MQSNAFSVEIKNIYQGKATIENQGQRNESIRNALKSVLSKLLSDQAHSNAEAIEAILAKSPQYVQQYRFENPRPADATNNENSPKLLIVDFNPFALNTALESHGFKIWGADRPEVLLWLVVEAKHKRNLFAADTMPELGIAIGSAVEKKGLALLFPLMDLTDRRQLTVSDIWIGFDDRIRQASQRYGVDHILAGRLIEKTANEWNVDLEILTAKSGGRLASKISESRSSRPSRNRSGFPTNDSC